MRHDMKQSGHSTSKCMIFWTLKKPWTHLYHQGYFLYVRMSVQITEYMSVIRYSIRFLKERFSKYFRLQQHNLTLYKLWMKEPF